MAAVFAGTSRATLTAIIILFEMTLNYSIILPLMFACVVSDALSTILSKETIYTRKIIKRGICYPYEREADILEMLFVKDFMKRDVKTVNEEMNVGEVSDIILHTGFQVFPVLNKKDDLIGIITYSDLIEPIEQNKLDVLVKDIEIKKMVTIYPDETLKRALKKTVLGDYDCLMVVDRNAPKKLVGLLSRSDIINAYRKEM
jgi:CIC family chloride channel protein